MKNYYCEIAFEIPNYAVEILIKTFQMNFLINFIMSNQLLMKTNNATLMLLCDEKCIT